MKKSLLLVTILGAFAATSCTHTRTPDKSADNQRGSTQRIGQSGSNGTGDGIKHNMLNGTGDGLQNGQWKTYSQQLEERGILASQAPHPVDTPVTDATRENQKAPSEAEADNGVLKH